ncbi:MAG: hypothetical protein ABW084_09525 [Candidatus Thiodiazotropha sp.]
MEEFKSLETLTIMDEKHKLMSVVCGYVPSLVGMHKYLADEELSDAVPEEIVGQFNVARNMALYSYFFYALSPEVHLKTYTIIEHALRIKTKPTKRVMLRTLIEHAIDEGWISDAGFRHLDNPSPINEWCKSMIGTIPKLRNSKAHGSTMLVGDCLHHISVCADFLNQLFPSSNKSKLSDLQGGSNANVSA